MISSHRIPPIATLEGPLSKYVTWEGGGWRGRKQQKNDIKRRTCGEKGGVPHTNYSIHFFLYSFLVSRETLIISQRATKRAHPRKNLPVYPK